MSFAATANTIYDTAIKPTCDALASELQRNPRGVSDASIDRWEDLRLAQLEIHRSLALGLGGLWERNFRLHLSHSASIIGPNSKTVLKTIQSGNWSELLAVFQRVRGFSLAEFPMYPELELLYRVTSAARHGTGKATRDLWISNPELFLEEDVTVSWYSYFTLGGEPPESIRKLEIDFELLTQFKDAVIEFWLAICVLQTSAESS